MLQVARTLLPTVLVMVACGGASPVLQAQTAATAVATSPAPAKSPPTATPSGKSEAPAAPSWSSLAPAEQKVLAPLAKDWSSLDASQKAKWLEVSARFPKMPAEDRARVQERMAEWARMTPLERGQARLTFQETKQLSPGEKQQRWEAYNALPESERRALAERSRQQAERGKATSTPATALNLAVPKQNLVSGTPASAPRGRPVAPTVVQAKPGATTTLMNKTPSPPSHQQPGQPKIAAHPDEVDRTTLLPKSGPQAAASAPQQP